MRFIRLRVANYRGITVSDVKFGSTGITLVQGPNEAGKSSLGEAIGLLFDFFDSSTHRSVMAIQPVHRDEGPEIELEAESGPYAFKYFKRFHKKPETRLTISKPKPENLTGREAHERAEAILRETLDIDLWKALTIQQCEGIQQPILTKQTSLSAALDKAAGGRSADPREEGLFEKVQEEYRRHFIESGAFRKELKEARGLQEEKQTEVAEIEKRIQDLEQDIERAATLQRELRSLKKREDELAAEVAAHASALEEITTLENAHAAARLKLESAQKSEEAAQRDKAARQEIIEAVARLTREHGALQESTDMSLPALSQAEDCLKNAQTASDGANKKRKAAEAIAAIRRADFDYYNSKLHLEQLQERKGRIDQARKDAAKAQEALARNKVTSRSLQVIQDAEKTLLTAQAKLETGAPHVRICGLSESHIAIDGVDVALGKGDVRDVPVGDSLRLSIPRKLEIEVRAGTSSEKLQKKVDEARDALQAACKAGGVTNAEEALKAAEERNEAMRVVKSKDQIEKDNLRDLTYEELEQKLLGLQQSVPEYLATRMDAPSICPDLDSAKKERARAEASHEAASGQWEAAREGVDAARAVRDGLNAKHQEARIELDQLTRNLKAASEKLDRARQTVPDDALETILTNAVATVTSEESAARTAEDSLKAKCPERVRTLADTAEASLQTARNRRTAAQTELIEVQTRLKIQGEEGLHEKLHAAQTHLERIGAGNQSLFQRASAAKWLFEIMLDERSKARRAYVAPLKEKIERLGRLVFNDSCEVDISEDLLIASRTAKGVTVPFDSLSGGTKEQLSLIFRLACAMTVAKDGGTPLIVDDALGYTEPDRLRLMGAVLAKAAKECQIVIFTCLPDRYSNIGEATVVSLA